MSDLASQLIAENRLSQATFLDLGNCGLRKVPAQIGELVWLKSLSFGTYFRDAETGNWIRSGNDGEPNLNLTHIGPLARLTGLQTLDLRETRVRELWLLAGLTGLQSLGLRGTRVRELEPLAGLTRLQRLDLRGTRVSEIRPLSGLTGLQSLDLIDTQVSELGPLAGLTGLQSLDLINTQVSELRPLAGLTGLQTLFLTSTQVSELGPLSGLTGLQSLQLSGTQVSELRPLAGLTGLQSLDLSDTQVSELGPLSGLTGLQTLDLRDTQVSDLRPLAGLTGLQSLYLSGTQVSELRPLAGLTGLQSLYLSGTQVSELRPLAGLTRLQRLAVPNTLVSNLIVLKALIFTGCPVRWSSDWWLGPGIYVEGCPLTNPPPEIASQGNEAILNYFAEREAGGVDQLYEAKMLILGEGGAGKTSLLRRLYQPGAPLPEEKDTTKGIAIHRHEFRLANGRTFRLNIWDFAGQEIYHATHQFFLTLRSLYVLVDDTRKDYKSVSDDGFRYWLDLIEVFGGQSPVVIFQNKKGGRSKAIDFAGIRGRYKNVENKLFEGDLNDAGATDQLRESIEFYASHLGHIGDELPARWIQVREEIETRAKETAHITDTEYFAIYARHLELDEAKALHLSRYLHDLGVFLHFQDDPLLARTVILQNEWATEAVFRILDDETIKKNCGRFQREDCTRLWKDSAYARVHPELLALMQRFELCYQLRDSAPPVWLAPELLPPARPDGLENWGEPGDLGLRYRYDFLPKGVTNRLMVRLHRFVQRPELGWATGVVFQRNNTYVHVEILPSGNEIELRARGPESKALLSIISTDLDALNESFPGLRGKIEKLVPCICERCRKVTSPYFFSESSLLRYKEHKILEVRCDESLKNVAVPELLDGLHPEPAATPLRPIRIFLASSAELRQDRDAFDLHLQRMNPGLLKRGLYVEIDRWEYFDDAVSATRLQEEYNKQIRQCDLFVSLFFTKVGKYTEEEFDIAHAHFLATGKPRIYTYFNNGNVKLSKLGKEFVSRLQFQEKLDALGHFPSAYENLQDLQLQFGQRLETFLDGLTLL